jgi:hypothetical protein
MTTPADRTPNQPDLRQLSAEFIRRRLSDPFLRPGDEAGEVLPHQASALHVIDPRTALAEAVEAADYLLPTAAAVGFRLPALKAPPDWPTLLRNQENQVAVPFCLGNFPQMVRDVSPLLTGTPPAELRPTGGRPVAVPDLEAHAAAMLAAGRLPDALFAAAGLRLANLFDQAGDLLDRVADAAPDEWAGLIQNEKAALAWHRGDAKAAAKLWTKNPLQASPVLWFNAGLANLFAGKPADAAKSLALVADALPERSAWHHLARLYLTLAS